MALPCCYARSSLSSGTEGARNHNIIVLQALNTSKASKVLWCWWRLWEEERNQEFYLVPVFSIGIATDSCSLYHSPCPIAAKKKGRSEVWDLKPAWLYLSRCWVDQCHWGKGQETNPILGRSLPNASCSPSLFVFQTLMKPISMQSLLD